MIIMGRISADKFMWLFNKATAIDYAGEYMSIQDDENDFVFLPNIDGAEEIRFNKSIINCGVYATDGLTMFCFDSPDCEMFSLLTPVTKDLFNDFERE